MSSSSNRHDAVGSEFTSRVLSLVSEPFERFAKEPDPGIRDKIAFENPLLLSRPAISAIKSLLERTGSEPSLAMERLAEIDDLRVHLARNPDSYPLGLGPVERLSEDFITGKISMGDAISKAGAPNVAEAVSSVYAHSVSWQAMRLCETREWRRGVIIYRLLCEAALAVNESLIIPSDVRDTVVGIAHVAVLAFTHGVDDVLYDEAMDVLTRCIAWAENNGDSEILGSLLHTLGTLHSDHYTVPRATEPSQTRIDLRSWLDRPHVTSSLFPNLYPKEIYPPPVAALKRAVHLYEQALPFRDGLKKGLTYKAIAQTLIFLSDALGEPIAEERLKSAVFEARTLLLKHPHPKHLETIDEIIKRKNYVSAEVAVIRDPKILSLLDQLAAANQSRSESDSVAESNGRALAELRRALTYRLQFALYLRNFSHSDIKHQVGQPFTLESLTTTMVVDPTVSYSIVDHKLLSLFPEGVVAIASPNSSIFSRLTLIPMFSLLAL